MATNRVGHDRTMVHRSELSALHSSLDEASRRVTSIAESARDEGDDDLAAELFAVERALNGALRRLRRSIRSES
jgi:hypothetical protein